MGDVVAERIRELDKLVAENPMTLTVKQVAEFLRCNEDGLRCALERGTVGFGFCWKYTRGGNRAFCIPTAQFYFWYTGHRPLLQLELEKERPR